MSLTRLFTFLLLAALAPLLPAVEVVLDGCRATNNWVSFNGAEFKGAKVSFSAASDGLRAYQLIN